MLSVYSVSCPSGAYATAPKTNAIKNEDRRIV
jgi:hypothetical protein